MKTPLQELIEDLQDMCPDYYNNNYNWLHNLLEKEKQTIINAFDAGSDLPIWGEEYYKNKFE